MVKIYCLVDPRNGLPFYVGRTTQKRLEKRLSAHVKDSKWCGVKSNKSHLIEKIIEQTGKRPLIFTLVVTSHELAPVFEEFMYWHFRNLGVEMTNNQYLFNYGKAK